MQVKPMIFNSDMVRALLEGRKTQTRRPVSIGNGWSINDTTICRITSPHPKKNKWGVIVQKPSIDDLSEIDIAPVPCNVGDLIYVRETFRIMDEDDDCDCEYPCGHKTIGYPAYFATDRDRECKWTPSIHMPRWASRLTLKVTSVRVERVQDISDDDCWKEAPIGLSLPVRSPSDFAVTEGGPKKCFKLTWESIYGESWNRNDWVWVIEFEVIRENVDAYLAKVKV